MFQPGYFSSSFVAFTFFICCTVFSVHIVHAFDKFSELDTDAIVVYKYTFIIINFNTVLSSFIVT